MGDGGLMSDGGHRPRLVVVSGPDEGRTLKLRTAPFSIGRQDGNDLQVLDASVSRRHCEIRRGEDGWQVVDLDSFHGTFVNGRPVHTACLAHGDFIQIGPSRLLFLHDVSASRTTSGTEADAIVAQSTIQRHPTDIAGLLQARKKTDDPTDFGLLLAISTAVQELREPRALAERLLEVLLGVLPTTDQGAVLLLDDASDEPQITAQSGDDRFEPSRTVVARVCAERVALLCDDVRHQDDLRGVDSLQEIAARSLLCAPLVGRHFHGVVYFQSSMVGALTADHLELITAAASLAALAFDTARSFSDLRRENRRLRDARAHGMVGESPAMKRLADFIDRVAPVDSTVLLRGESGTGKELAARAIHRGSPRADGPLVEINCATLSETLLESELFGHERGAFTGAVARKIGRLEAADGGTLFLDEVGEIPPGLQARLLRVLQERRFERLGSTRAIEVDVRLIAATNRDLEAAIRDGGFREDLFYRLDVISFTLPPLRERRDDVPLLARHFARHHSERLKRPVPAFEPTALRAMSAYDWPGNVRQLSNAVERALVLGDGERLRPEDLPDEIIETSVDEVPLSDFQTAIAETKKRLLLTALDASDGNAAAAARALGLHPNSFRRLMRQLGLRSRASD